MLKLNLIPLVAVCIIALPSCNSLSTALFGPPAAGLTNQEKYPEFPRDQDQGQNAQIDLLNTQVAKYNELVKAINDYLKNVDGRGRRFSIFALGGRGFVGGTNVASAALAAASPAANLVWTQGLTATNAAYGNLESEMDTHRLSGVAIRESMKLTAADLTAALAKLRFYEAYSAILGVEQPKSFLQYYNENRAALIELETALVLKPFTHVITVTTAKPQGKQGESGTEVE